MKSLIIAVLAVLVVGTTQAQLIEVGGTEYDILWELGTFEAVDARHNLQGQIWWGNNELAAEFSETLGYFDDGDVDTFLGPYFATSMVFWDEVEAPGILVFSQAAHIAGEPWYTHDPWADFSSHGLLHSWAFVSNSVPVPSSFALIALGLAVLGLPCKVRS